MHEMIFAARNRHVESCGKPPEIAAGGARFTSYFENELGEQMIFVHEPGALAGVVYSGDCNWGKPITVPVVGLTGHSFTQAEGLWVAACLMVVRRRLDFDR